MKSRLLLLSFFASLIIGSVGYSMMSIAEDMLGHQYMDIQQIKNKWGLAKFDAVKFKNGSAEERATMAFDVIKSKFYINKSVDQVFNELGPSTGLYFSEMIPAYVIGDINEKPDELWQLVFLLNRDSTKVTEVKVHKKCCY